jgi:hypothetical protein
VVSIVYNDTSADGLNPGTYRRAVGDEKNFFVFVIFAFVMLLILIMVHMWMPTLRAKMELRKWHWV